MNKFSSKENGKTCTVCVSIIHYSINLNTYVYMRRKYIYLLIFVSKNFLILIDGFDKKYVVYVYLKEMQHHLNLALSFLYVLGARLLCPLGRRQRPIPLRGPRVDFLPIRLPFLFDIAQTFYLLYFHSNQIFSTILLFFFKNQLKMYLGSCCHNTALILIMT